MLVSDYMSKSPFTIAHNAEYDRAFEIMEKRNLHHLPVVNKKGYVVGIVTRRDLQLAARHFHEAPAEICEIMHAPVVTITADASMTTAAERMTQFRIGGLPVLDEEKRIVGMLTETDVFRAFVKLVDDHDDKARKSSKARKGDKKKNAGKHKARAATKKKEVTGAPVESITAVKKKPAAKKKAAIKKKAAVKKKSAVRRKSVVKKKAAVRRKSTVKKKAAVRRKSTVKKKAAVGRKSAVKKKAAVR